ncbi:MAG: hypothetical protein Q9227_001846 [Pyrenula ochraceoflavens]
MGIPGILDQIGKGERVALSKLAVEHLETYNQPLRIAIDIAIWNFQSQSTVGGANAPVRNFYFRLLRLLALPIQPLFVYDGPNKPTLKRNKVVTGIHSSATTEACKKLLQLFHFPYLTAPGEAEAECAALQKQGIVDAVMSQDADTMMFGSTMTIKDWSAEGQRSKSATHVNVLRTDKTGSIRGLDPAGMILVALLSGGDYNTEGLPGFGAITSCDIAKAGFGRDLMEAMGKRNEDPVSMAEWRQRLNYELEYNESGFFKRRSKKLKIPDTYPDEQIYEYYVNPAISSKEDLVRIEREINSEWAADVDVAALREFVAYTFEWKFKSGARKFMRSFAPSLLAYRLQRKQAMAEPHVQAVLQRRQHYESDAMPELRIQIVATEVVGINLEDEEDNPLFMEHNAEDSDAEAGGNDVSSETPAGDTTDLQNPKEAPILYSPRKVRKSPPYDPTQPDKIWLPETIVRLGAPLIVEDWDEAQLALQRDPKKFATRKCAPKKLSKSVDKSMKHGALNDFFRTSKKDSSCSEPNSSKTRHPLHPLSPISQPQSATSKSTISSKPTSKISSTASQSKLTGTINPFTLAQRPPAKRSTPDDPSTALAIKSLPSNPSRSASPIMIISSPTQSPNVALSTRNCSPSSTTQPLLIPRTRAPKKPFQRSHTDPSITSDTHPPDFLAPFSPPPSSQPLPQAPQAAPLKTTTHRTVISRDSLPGHWMDFVNDDWGAGGEMEREKEKGRARKAARVSVLDLT